jgi:hypothetical protein
MDFLPRGDKNNNKFTIETTNIAPKHKGLKYNTYFTTIYSNKDLTRTNKFKMKIT